MQFYTNTNKQAKKLKIYFQDTISNYDNLNLKFFSWTTIIQVKKQLQKFVKTTHNNMRLFYKNIQLNKNGRRLLDYHIKHRQVIIIKMTPQLQNSLGILNPYLIFSKTPIQIDQLLQNVKTGFLKGIKPKLTQNGTSGSYFLQNHVRRNVGIFKPFDQQPFAPNNPRNFKGQLGTTGFRNGILSGQSATRQVAAYLINKNNFHSVPPTTYVQFYHPSFQQRQYKIEYPIKSDTIFNIKNQNQKKTKHGSLQAFIPSDDVIGNFGSNIFSVQQIHKIAILDIRILNCDRNQQNILVKKGSIQVQTSNGYKTKKDYKLIPIDHGLSFPDCFQIYDYQIIWMDYNQSLQPFTQNQLKFIQSIDPITDCQNLKEKLGFREICLRNFRIAQTFLKKAAKLGFTPNQIGHMIYRKQIDQEIKNQNMRFSQLERLVNQAQNIYALVKQNGIKSTVQFLIGLIKHPDIKNKEKRFSKNSIYRNEKDLIQIIQNERQDSEQQYSPKKQRDDKQENNKRAVSLPNSKKKREFSTNQQNKNNKLGKKLKLTTKKSDNQQKWEQIFYHYFQDIVDRYLKDKKKQLFKRQRFQSQTLQF